MGEELNTLADLVGGRELVMLFGFGSITISTIEEGRVSLVPFMLAAADECLSSMTGCLLLLVDKECGHIPKAALEGGKSSRGGSESVMSIFCPKNLFRLGSRAVGCRPAKDSFQVLVLSFHLPDILTRGQAD